jgi:hypothetical protein
VITYRVISTSDGVDTCNYDHVINTAESPQPSHFTDIMARLDELGLEFISATVLPDPDKVIYSDAKGQHTFWVSLGSGPAYPVSRDTREEAVATIKYIMDSKLENDTRIIQPPRFAN